MARSPFASMSDGARRRPGVRRGVRPGDGGAVLVRPDGVVAWRSDGPCRPIRARVRLAAAARPTVPTAASGAAPAVARGSASCRALRSRDAPGLVALAVSCPVARTPAVTRPVSRRGSATTKRDCRVAVRLEEDPAAHRGHQPPRREQADARAARPAAPLDPDERLEDALPVLDRDARAVVGDVDLDLVAEPPDRRCSRRRPIGAYFDSFSRSCSRTCRKRASSPMAVDRAGRSAPSGSGAAGAGAAASRPSRRPPGPRRTARATGRSGPRRGPTPGSSRRGGPGGRAGRRRRRASPARPARRGSAGGRLGEQVDVDAHDRQRRPQLVGHDAEQLGPRGIERGQLGEPRLDLGGQPALLDDPGQQRGDGLQEVDLVVARTGGRSRVWTLRTPTTSSCQTSGTDSIAGEALDVEAADPREARVAA